MSHATLLLARRMSNLTADGRPSRIEVTPRLLPSLEGNTGTHNMWR